VSFRFIVSELITPLGGYKTLQTWSEKDFDLTSTILKFLRVNAAPFFDLTLDIDPRDKSKYALVVELPRPTSLVPNLFQPLSQQDDVLLVSPQNDISPNPMVKVDLLPRVKSLAQTCPSHQEMASL